MGATEDSLDSSSHKGNSLVDEIKSFQRSRVGRCEGGDRQVRIREYDKKDVPLHRFA